MDFVAFIREYLPEGYDIKITDEVSFDYNPEIDNVIIRKNQGNQYTRGVVVPISIMITTKNVSNAFDIWKNWVMDVSDKDYNEESSTENYYMMFMTPSVVQLFDEISNNYYQVLTIIGTIVVTYGVLDIKKLEIDNQEVDINELSYQLVNQPDISQTITGGNLSVTTIENSVLSFTLNTFLTNEGNLGLKLLNMRKGIISGDTSFSIKFTYNNGDVENIDMKLTSQNIVKTRGSITLLSLAFAH